MCIRDRSCPPPWVGARLAATSRAWRPPPLGGSALPRGALASAAAAPALAPLVAARCSAVAAPAAGGCLCGYTC
eukprot:13505128-Alexandrium_andersonii.AAC.1